MSRVAIARTTSITIATVKMIDLDSLWALRTPASEVDFQKKSLSKDLDKNNKCTQEIIIFSDMLLFNEVILTIYIVNALTEL